MTAKSKNNIKEKNFMMSRLDSFSAEKFMTIKHMMRSAKTNILSINWTSSSQFALI
jgi:hypothetical protein